MSETVFLHLLGSEDKATALANAVTTLRQGRPKEPLTYVVNPRDFLKIPGAPFAYWVSQDIRRLFTEFPPFQANGRQARRGPSTGDDGRRVRAWWEVDASQIGRERQWVPFSKGGAYSPYYADPHLVVAWDETRRTFRDFWGRPGRMIERPESLEFFFRPALTYSLRTQRGLSFRILNEGCVFGHKGPALFAGGVDELRSLLALTNSRAFQSLVALQMVFGSYEVGVIQRTPVPELGDFRERLAELATSCVAIKRGLDQANEISHVFDLPGLLQVEGDSIQERIERWQLRVSEAEDHLAANQAEIERIAFGLYGISDADREAIEKVNVGGQSNDTGSNVPDDDGEEIESYFAPVSPAALVTGLLSYAVGCSFGRWDLRIALDRSRSSSLPDVFAPLPRVSPGMLVGPEGLPADQDNRSPVDHAQVSWDGVLVDDGDHKDDIETQARRMLEVLWEEHAEAVEREACRILGVGDLREYFRNPKGFFQDHIKLYSRSRRKAPIYWLLQSSNRSFGIWLYYQRLNKDLLFKVIINYVDPKIRLEEDRLEQLRLKRSAGLASDRPGRDVEKALERQDALLLELQDFREKLDRVAKLYLAPDLNDGVILNIAPVWEVVPWTEAKVSWQELRMGKYEWSSVAAQLRDKGLI